MVDLQVYILTGLFIWVSFAGFLYNMVAYIKTPVDYRVRLTIVMWPVFLFAGFVWVIFSGLYSVISGFFKLLGWGRLFKWK